MNTLVVSLRAFVFFTLLTGVLYTFVVDGLARLVFPRQSGGSIVTVNGKVVGSELISQKFVSAKYFWPRPSGVDYNPLPSGATNFGPSSADLKKAVLDRKAQLQSYDMLYASASGLDPHISPRAAYDQTDRIALARKLGPDGTARILALVKKHVEGRQYGVLGEERVNVLMLNIALDIELGNG
jgi:K+-transporting ATPase ATPase C chain